MGSWKVSAMMIWIFSLCRIRLSCASQNTTTTALFGSFGQLAVDIRVRVQPDAVSLMQIACRGHPKNPHGKIGNVSVPYLVSRSIIVNAIPGLLQTYLATYAYVFRALPTQVACEFAIGYLPTLDRHMRFTQPFVGMFDEAGDAATTIALSYLMASSLEVPLHAFYKGQWKVAWFAILATLAALFPVLVSALFTITQTGSKLHLALDWPTFAMVMGYLLAFNVSLPSARPTRSRRQPRHILSLADIMGMCHQARFLADPLFDIASPASSKEKMDAQLLLRENKYLFGRYLGRDGKTHLGFDVSETDIGGPTGTVMWIPPKPGYMREADKRPSALYRLFQKKHSKLPQNDSEDGIKLRHVRNSSGPSAGDLGGQSDPLSHSTAVQVRPTV